MSVTPVTKKARPLTQQQKYRAVFPLCKYLAELVSEETKDRYLDRVDTLKKLINDWEGERADRAEKYCHEQHSTAEMSLLPSDFPHSAFFKDANELPAAALVHPATTEPLGGKGMQPAYSPGATAHQMRLDMVSNHAAPLSPDTAAAGLSAHPDPHIVTPDTTEAALSNHPEHPAVTVDDVSMVTSRGE